MPATTQVPTNDAVREYYNHAGIRNKTSKGFSRGTVERAAYIDWYVSQIPQGFLSPRGHLRTTHGEKRFQALYHLERVLLSDQRRAQHEHNLAIGHGHVTHGTTHEPAALAAEAIAQHG